MQRLFKKFTRLGISIEQEHIKVVEVRRILDSERKELRRSSSNNSYLDTWIESQIVIQSDTKNE